MARDIASEIDYLCARRAELWSAGDGDGSDELKAIASKLARLYEEKRTNAASQGTNRQKQKVVKRALVEKELDRLMMP